MTTTRTYKGVLQRYENCAPEIRKYFEYVPRLVSEFPWEISIAYAFSRVELAQNMTIYCAAVKMHRADSSVARSAIDSLHMTRASFIELSTRLLGKEVPKHIVASIRDAERMRDRAMHGKTVLPADFREAVVNVFVYAQGMNEFCQSRGGFRPFSDLRGFKGRAQSLDKATTQWLLKGLGVLK